MTFADLKERVALDLEPYLDVLNGDEIGQAVKDAIASYEHERLWFLEGEDASTTTVAGTPDYALPAELIEMDSVTITIAGNRYQLTQRSWDWYREHFVNISGVRGQPSRYVIHQGRSWLWPTPDGAYTVTYSGLFAPAELSADGDENVWTGEAAQLIRAHAKRELCASILPPTQDVQVMAQRYGAVAEAELRRLRERSWPRVATGRITPTSF